MACIHWVFNAHQGYCQLLYVYQSSCPNNAPLSGYCIISIHKQLAQGHLASEWRSAMV